MHWLNEFDEFAGEYLHRKRVPGAAVVVVQDGECVYTRGFGWRDREARLPVTPRTVFGLASLSKSVTALTALVLVSRGELSLDDRIAALLPGFDYPGLGKAEDGRHDVRLWHMLSHTTGVPPLRALDYALKSNQAADPADAYSTRRYQDPPSIGDYDELIEYMRVGERPALASPGSVASYSNECVALVGAVIERATGRAFPEVVAESVFAPLGMSTATYSTDAAMATGDVATLYTHDPSGAVIRSHVWNESPAYLGTGFMKASADDLGRYLRFLLRGDGAALGMNPGLLGELVTPRAWAAPGAGYGLGWNVRQQVVDGRHLTVVRHGGSLKGVSSSQGFVPELGLGVAVLTNVDDAPALRLWHAALNLATGQDPAKAVYDGWPYRLVEGRDERDEDLVALAGVYASGEPWGRLEVTPAESDGSVHLNAYAGDDREPVGRVGLLVDGEFVLVTQEDGREAAWDGGRFHFGPDGRAVAVQHGLRWYDREES